MTTKRKQEGNADENADGTFTSGGKTYEFIVPQFMFENKGLVTAEEALKDPALLDKLVEMKAGVIKEVF